MYKTQSKEILISGGKVVISYNDRGMLISINEEKCKEFIDLWSANLPAGSYRFHHMLFDLIVKVLEEEELIYSPELCSDAWHLTSMECFFIPDKRETFYDLTLWTTKAVYSNPMWVTRSITDEIWWDGYIYLPEVQND